jgi:rRNA-processing protein FCF1
MSQQQNKSVTVLIPKLIYDQLEAIAKEQDKSISQVFRSMAKDYVKDNVYDIFNKQLDAYDELLQKRKQLLEQSKEVIGELGKTSA